MKTATTQIVNWPSPQSAIPVKRAEEPKWLQCGWSGRVLHSPGGCPLSPSLTPRLGPPADTPTSALSDRKMDGWVVPRTENSGDIDLIHGTAGWSHLTSPRLLPTGSDQLQRGLISQHHTYAPGISWPFVYHLCLLPIVFKTAKQTTLTECTLI